MDRTEGFFRVSADGSFEKLGEFPGPPPVNGLREFPVPEAYADEQGNLYVLSPNGEHKQNGMTHVQSGRYGGWWDYTFWEAVGSPDW